MKHSKIIFDKHQIEVYPLHELIHECEKDIVKHLEELCLLDELNFRKNDVKRIFYHYIVKRLLDDAMQLEKGFKRVYYFDKNDIICNEFADTTTNQRYRNFIITIVEKCEKLLPIHIYIDNNTPYEKIIEYKEKDNGEIKEFLILIKSIVYNSDLFEKYTFKPVKHFIKKNQLTYLHAELFTNLKMKHMLIK